MAKIFITVAGLIALLTLAGCNAGGPSTSSATDICTAALDPFRTVCDDVENIRDEQVGWCLMAANRVGMERCTELNDPCVNDPFTTECEAAQLDDFLLFNAHFNRVQHCNSGGIRAVGCTGYNACTDTNPFDAGCVSSQFTSARATRITFCTAGEDDSDPTDADCTARNVGDSARSIVYCIATNPFDAACNDDTFGAAFDEVRREFVEACDVNSPDAMRCGQPIGDTTQTVTSCINNPFHPDCNDIIAFNSARVTQITDCGANSMGANCTTVLSRNVTAAVLLSSRRIASVPDTANPGNQFLRGTEITEDSPAGFDFGTAQASPTRNERPNVTSLNLATASFQRAAVGEEERPARTRLGGNDSDGVAFFFGTVNAGTSDERANAYAGILAGTDLGERLMQKNGTATWHGRFQTIESTPVNTDFDLNITFNQDGGVLDAFVKAVPASTESRLHYSLDGRFNSQGIIDGTITRGNFATGETTTPLNRLPRDRFEYGLGTLQGLIGQEGAVGAFIRDDANNTLSTRLNFAGGFVACPLHDDGRCMNATRDETPAPSTP